MTESLKGKCNKCGKEYTAAPIGVFHKCGCCEEEIRRQVEKEICDYFRVKTDLPWCGLDPHTASCISDLIEKRKYLPPKTSD